MKSICTRDSERSDASFGQTLVTARSACLIAMHDCTRMAHRARGVVIGGASGVTERVIENMCSLPSTRNLPRQVFRDASRWTY